MAANNKRNPLRAFSHTPHTYAPNSRPHQTAAFATIAHTHTHTHMAMPHVAMQDGDTLYTFPIFAELCTRCQSQAAHGDWLRAETRNLFVISEVARHIATDAYGALLTPQLRASMAAIAYASTMPLMAHIVEEAVARRLAGTRAAEVLRRSVEYAQRLPVHEDSELAGAADWEAWIASL